MLFEKFHEVAVRPRELFEIGVCIHHLGRGARQNMMMACNLSEIAFWCPVIIGSRSDRHL
jgi:hypothetical protein